MAHGSIPVSIYDETVFLHVEYISVFCHFWSQNTDPIESLLRRKILGPFAFIFFTSTRLSSLYYFAEIIIKKIPKMCIHCSLKLGQKCCFVIMKKNVVLKIEYKNALITCQNTPMSYRVSKFLAFKIPSISYWSTCLHLVLPGTHSDRHFFIFH